MILSDDDFAEPEIDLGVHIHNIQKTVYSNVLRKKVDNAIKDKQSALLKQLIEEEWDGETAFYPVNDDNIKNVVKFSVKALGDNANLNWIDTSNVTDMSYLFSTSEFDGDISNWDVSHVTTMWCLFYDSVFNGDISGWNVSKVTDMRGMFHHSEFNGDISGWNVSHVTDMVNMFYDSKFNGDISGWDVSNVIDMTGMFYSSEFNRDISEWNISNVTDKRYIFDNCPIKKEYKPKLINVD